MVGTITPVVHGGRRAPWAASVALHAVGAGGAAAALGALLGAAGAAVGAPWGGAAPLLVAAVAGLYAARELFGVPIPVPERRRQVPEWWRTYFPPPAAALLYGAGLGIGFLTYLRHGTLVAVTAAALAFGDPALGALVVAPFGVARAASLVVVARARTPDRVSAVADRLEGMALTRLPAAANGIVLAALGVAAVAAGRNPGRIPDMAAALLALVFAWAAAAKVIRWDDWRASLRAHRLGALRPVAAVAVPPAEAAVAALVLVGMPGAAGAVALALLAAFCAALVRSRRDGTAPCACFGRTRRRSLRALLLRNAGLAGVAAVSLAAEPLRRLSLPAPAAGDALPTILTGLALVGTAAAVAATRRWLRPTDGAGGTSPRPGAGRSTPGRTAPR